MDDSTGPELPADGSGRHGHPGRYARLALITAAVTAVVCLALLLIIFVLDSFNATVYSVGEKDINDATDEASQIRGLYAAARTGSVIFLLASVGVAAAAGFTLYRNRRRPHGDDDGEFDDGEDVGLNGLTGR